jgi:SAM-dependent methyltransferase
MIERSCVTGRLRVIQKLMSKGKFSLSVGSKETRFADINLDIDYSVRPDIVADARFLLFKNKCFQQVLFTDVIEHLPKGSELKALKEIHRVLVPGGELIFSTPHDVPLYTFLDVARYVVTHRHYKIKDIQKLLENSGFNVKVIFTAGGLWTLSASLLYYLIIFPMKKLLRIDLPYTLPLISRYDNEDYKIVTKHGYTIFAKAFAR